MISHNSQSDLQFRFYRPEDRETVIDIFKRQPALADTALPLPEDDVSTMFVLVGEREGKVVRALLLRATAELYYITGADEPQGHELRRLGYLAEGALMQLNVTLNEMNRLAGIDLRGARFPVFTDATAYVPKVMPKMIEFLKRHLGFIDEPLTFHRLFKRVGR